MSKITSQVLTALLSLLLLGDALAQIPSIVSPAGVEPPNFVIILADDLGFGDLGCYGHASFQTPHLDKMASQGVRFTDFTTTFPACAPSRTSLLTGRYHFRSGMFRNPTPDVPDKPELNLIGIPEEAMLLPEALWASGYATGMIGKWHLGHQPAFFPTRNGFEEYLGILYSNDMRPVQLIDGEEVVEFPVLQEDLTKRYTERAVDFIDRKKGGSFFLYLAHAMPHKPLAASEAFLTADEPDDLYANVIEELDWSVGQVLQKLKSDGLDADTLVIFTSDNGPWFGGSTGGLRGMKASTFEGGLRVPLIARWPGKIPSGQVCSQVASMVDIMPTLLTLSSPLPPVSDVLDGQNLIPLMTDSAAISAHEAIYSLSGEQIATVRAGKWKLHVTKPRDGRPAVLQEDAWVDPRAPDGETILAPLEQPRGDQFPGSTTGDPPAPMMLFDLESDPGESQNVADANPEVLARLQELAEAMNREIETAKAGQ